jgi:outer membrane receptor for ferrienterochelin and colicin
LPPGDYELKVALAGFESIHRTIRIESGKTISLSLTMLVASLEQTVMTAAKTGATDVQSAPFAISAISSTALSRFAITTIDEAAAQTPLITFTQNTTFGQLSIRGIGTNAVFASADPSSAMYLDGVYLARPAMAFTGFLDVERIEIVRGPQGTLYGRNALGGAVNLVTKAPSNEFEALARVTIGNLAERRAQARLGGALKRDRVMGASPLLEDCATATCAISIIQSSRSVATTSPRHAASSVWSSIPGLTWCCRLMPAIKPDAFCQTTKF